MIGRRRRGIGTITPEERKAVMAQSPVKGKYDQAVDPESAYEVLQKRVQGGAAAPPANQPAAPAGQQGAADGGGGVLGQLGAVVGSIFGTSVPRGKRLSEGQPIARSVTRTVTNQVAGRMAADIGRSLGGSLGGSVGRAIVRGALGGILRR